MEQHIKIGPEAEELRPDPNIDPSAWFKKAVEFAAKYYSSEIERASSVKFKDVSPDLFFTEYIWVVHATGFSAKAVSRFIHRLLEAYGSYEHLSRQGLEEIYARVLPVVNNKEKVKSVWKTSKLLFDGISKDGWESYKSKNLYPVDKLSSLPYIGNITKFHLGRNIGILDCVKPDLHLVRMAGHWGFSDAVSMIKYMNVDYDYPLGIADMIAWYYASHFGTGHMKKDGER